MCLWSVWLFEKEREKKQWRTRNKNGLCLGFRSQPDPNGNSSSFAHLGSSLAILSMVSARYSLSLVFGAIFGFSEKKNIKNGFWTSWWMRKRKRVGKKELGFLHFSVFLQNCAVFFFFLIEFDWFSPVWLLRKWEWNLERKWSLVDSFYFFLLILFYYYYSLNLCSVSLRAKWIVFEKLFSLMAK